VLFVLVRKATPDKVLEEIKGSGGKVLETSGRAERRSAVKSRTEMNDIFSASSTASGDC
jgi:uncharacterized membrane protein